MANQEQVELLKQSAEVWNEWRRKNPKAIVDLNLANLSGANLSEADLRGADLRGAGLSEADLSSADLSSALLYEANLTGANLRGANLRGAYLRGADLSGADLSRANLSETDLSRAVLYEAKLNGAVLYEANLSEASLNKANLSKANLEGTIFAGINLEQTYGLESIRHYSSSFISTGTLQLSKGEIPEAFLRGCGLSDLDIEYSKLHKPGLSNQEINNIIYKMFDLRANQSIQISPLFISYSHADTPFVERLEDYLNKKGIRFWRDVHHATAGRLEKQIDRAMRQNPTVILILSENSISSDWVEHEARLARNLEKELGRDVLCPITLDESWKTAKWPARLMEQIMEYNILDYSIWHDDKAFKQIFNNMISGLDMFYKPDKESSK